MTISLHVDRCGTCVKYCVDRGLEFDHVIDCPDCDGRGWTLPGWPWVRVPTIEVVVPMTRKNITVSRSNHVIDGETSVSVRAAHPDWQPGVTITPTTELVPYGDPCPCDGEHTVPVGPAVITKIIPVISKADWYRRQNWTDRAVVIGEDRTAYLFDPCHGRLGEFAPLSIDCTPGDVLARLETT